MNRDAVNAELQARRDLGERLACAFAAGQAVGDDADFMAAVGLSVGEIEDVTKDAADRRARRVQDTKGTVGGGHGQRSLPRADAQPDGAGAAGSWRTAARTPFIRQSLGKLDPIGASRLTKHDR